MDSESHAPVNLNDSSDDADERQPMTAHEYCDDDGDFILDVSTLPSGAPRDSRKTAFEGKRKTRVSSAEREILKTVDTKSENKSMLESAEKRQEKYDEFCRSHLIPFENIIDGMLPKTF